MCSDSSHYGQNGQTSSTLIFLRHWCILTIWCVRSDFEPSRLVIWSLLVRAGLLIQLWMRFLYENTQTKQDSSGGSMFKGGGRQLRTEEWTGEKREWWVLLTTGKRNESSKWSVIMQLRVKRRVCQSCNRSVSRCVKRQDEYATCPNVAASHQSNEEEPVCRVLLHSSHACVAQHMQPVLPCTLDSVILYNRIQIFGLRAKDSVNVPLKTH